MASGRIYNLHLHDVSHARNQRPGKLGWKLAAFSLGELRQNLPTYVYRYIGIIMAYVEHNFDAKTTPTLFGLACLPILAPRLVLIVRLFSLMDSGKQYTHCVWWLLVHAFNQLVE